MSAAFLGHILQWLIPEDMSFPERKVCVTKHNYWSTIIVHPDNKIRDGPRDRLHHICDNAAMFQHPMGFSASPADLSTIPEELEETV